MTQAKTPHFMQMHSGDIDTERLKTFAEQNNNVEEYSGCRISRHGRRTDLF